MVQRLTKFLPSSTNTQALCEEISTKFDFFAGSFKTVNNNAFNYVLNHEISKLAVFLHFPIMLLAMLIMIPSLS